MDSIKEQMSAAWKFVRSVQETGKIPDGQPFQRMLMKRLATAALAYADRKAPVHIDCAAEIGVAGLFPLQVVQLGFTIGDWAMVTAVEATAERQVLRIQPSTLRESDGLETSGLIGWIEDKPVVAITATPNIETVFVRIGGFDRSIVLHDGVLTSRV